MIDFFLKKWLKQNDYTDPAVRKAYGTCSSIVGIFCNLLLFTIKYAVGVFSHSIAIISDAFNNLSDCASCLVTLIGYKLAAKPADKEHPFGHGRMEYLTALAIAVIIALMGFELLESSIDKLLHPEAVFFHMTTLLTLLASVGIKLFLMHFNHVLGARIQSSTILATSKDSRNDVIATSAVIVALLCSTVTDFPIDGIIGVAVSLFILKSAWDIVRDTISDLLGKPADPQVVTQLRSLILAHPEIEGIHDVLLHNYGPGKMLGSCHVEVRSDTEFVAVHAIVDTIEHEIYTRLHILMTIHMDPIELNNAQTLQYQKMTERIIQQLNQNLSIHDFRLVAGEKEKRLAFDLVVPFSCPYEDAELCAIISNALQKEDSTCTASIFFDRDYTSGATTLR